MSVARHRLRRCAIALVALAAGLAIDVAIPRSIAFASGNVLPTLLHATWTGGTPISLPQNAGSGPAPSLDSVSCYAAGSCTAAGSYKDSSSLTQAMVLSEASGTWGQATEITAPSDAGGQPDATLNGVSCVSAISCTVVGSYEAAVGEQEAMSATLSSGGWGGAVRVSAPAGAASDPEATLASVSCANAGDCTAVGSYQDSSSVTQAMIATSAAGSFAVATEVSPPAGASATPGTTLGSVSCFRTTDCTVVGSYVDSSGHQQAFFITESSGAWGAATAIEAPANAASNPQAVLSSVSCFDALDCTAFGSYSDSSGHEEAMAATELGGSWAQATEITAPANGYPNPQATLTAGSCTGAVTCTAVGTYEDLTASTQPLIEVEQGGTWSQAGELSPSADAGADPMSTMNGISCSSSGTCAAVGDYTSISGAPEAATFTEMANPTFAVGVPTSYTIVSIGSPTPVLTESGTLPSGVGFLDQGDGFATIGGTPASGTVGSTSFTVAADNAAGSSSQTFTALVDQAPSITSASSTSLTLGTAGSFQFVADGYPAPSFAETGALPQGVWLTSSGQLEGTPVATTGGSYPITVTATNGIGSAATQSFTLAVTAGTQSISSASSTTFTVGTPGNFTISASGGTAAASFSETGALPAGVSLSPAGVLSGIPAAGSGGLYPIIVTASNGIASAVTQDFTLTVDQTPGITNVGNATFTVGRASSVTLVATGYPAPAFTESGGLPPGVTLGGGVISGTPTPPPPSSSGSSAASGTASAPVTSYPIVLTATNAAGTATQDFTLSVNQAPAFTSTDTANFVAGEANTFDVTATGLPAATFTESGALPPGVSLSSTGVLSGVPASGAGGQYFITLQATNNIGNPAVQLFTLNVDAPPKITSVDKTGFVIGNIDVFTVQTSGFPAATVSVAGTLPAGVIFVNNEFTGVPTGLAPTGATTGGATRTSGSSGSPSAKVPMVYPLTLTASNGVGSSTATGGTSGGSTGAGSTTPGGAGGTTDVQTFELFLSKQAPPPAGTILPVVLAQTVKAVGGKKPTSVPVKLSCPRARCAATLLLVKPTVVALAERVFDRKQAIARPASTLVDELLGSATVSTTKKAVGVRVALNPAGKAVLASLARSKVTLALSLIETAGTKVRRVTLKVRG